MLFSTFVWGATALVSTAAAEAATKPKLSTSTGFYIRVHVNQKITDGDPYDVDKSYVSLFRQPSDFDRQMAQCSVQDDTDAAIFYLNGTAAEVKANKATLVTDFKHNQPNGAGTIQEPFSLNWYNESTTTSEARVYFTYQYKYGVPGYATISAVRPGVVVIGPQRFYQTFWSHAHHATAVLGRIDVKDGKADDEQYKVVLIPECADLPPPKAPTGSSHKYAVEVQCYEDLDKGDWSIFNI
ncbi:hypothetical protein VHEMI09591 [[Torrubiella] hemipterigena]|uniref:Uncharacterized protein n=1 Tax=[Torrubiella] hemipterigena TaxID=1531966 RepID=A0A0A1TQB4_9HYPO|nr:hypothetical protein VHEMI09591 [[Torrubiella] hemipterigena]